MPLTDAGVRFKSVGFNEFIRNIGEASKTIVSLGRMTENRLQALRELNNILATGSVYFKDFAKSADEATFSLSKSLSALSKVTGAIGGNLGGALSKIVGSAFKGMSIGGAIGTLFPGIGNALGASLGAASGAMIGAISVIKSQFEKLITTVAGLAGKVVKSFVQAGISIGNAILNFGKKIMSLAGSILRSIIGVIGNLFSSIIGMFTGGGGGAGGWRSLGSTIFTAMFKFEVLKQVIRGIINKIKEFASASLDAAEELQVLTARVDNLIASQIRAAGLTSDYSESIQMATGYTKGLVEWMQRLALATPISVEDISNVTYLSLAMGWSVKAAKSLTSAIIDYTSALGMGSEISERIIYNFAQMKNQGKVTGTELRDLGRGAFMPVNDILKEMYDQMGQTTMSFQQFKEEAAAGKVSVEGFFTAFESWVNKNMPNMAEKMNYTFKAVKQNVQDLFKVLLGWNVLGPMIVSITRPFQDFINRFKSPDVLEKANAIGKAMAYMIDRIREGFSYVTNVIGALLRQMGIAVPSVRQIAQTIIKLGLAIREVFKMVADALLGLMPVADQIGDKYGESFKKMREDAFGWGLGLIKNFAMGIIKGAAKFLVTAINFVASLLTKWFKPGSPPLILPLIDVWGMETINEWLHGFTQADFDILDDLKSIVKESLGALVNLGILTENQSAQQYVELSQALMQAMDELNRTGQITSDIFEQLQSIAGAYGQEIAELFQLQIQHVQALERVTQAQKEYDDAVKATQESSVKTNKLIREYNTMLRKGADKNQLKDKLKLVNASEYELIANKKSELQKKDALDVAEEQLKLIEEQVKWQESLIKQLIDLAQAQKEATETDMAGAIEETTEAIDDLIDGLGDLENSVSAMNFDMWVRQAEEEFKKQWGEFVDDIGNTWFKSFTDPGSKFQLALTSIKTAWSGTISGLKQGWDEFAAAIGLPSIDRILEAWNNPPQENLPGHDFGGGPEFGGQENVTLLSRFQSVLNTFAESIKTNGGILATMKDIAGWLWDKLIESIANWVAPIENAPTGTLGLENWYAGNATERLKAKFLELGKSIGQGIAEGVVDAITTFDWNVNAWGLIETGFKSFFDIGTIFSGLFFLNGTSVIDGLTGGMVDALTTFDWVRNAWELITKPFKDFFKMGSPSGLFKEYGEDIITGLSNGITSMIDSVIGPEGTISKAIKKIISTIRSILGLDGTTPETNPLIKIGTDIVNGLKNGIEAMDWAIKQAIDFIVGLLPEWARKLLGMGSPSKVFHKIGENTILGLVKGIEDSAGLVKAAMKQSIQANMMQPAMAQSSQMSSGSVYPSTTLNFGNVYINNGMDWAIFKERVQRALIEG